MREGRVEIREAGMGRAALLLVTLALLAQHSAATSPHTGEWATIQHLTHLVSHTQATSPC